MGCGNTKEVSSNHQKYYVNNNEAPAEPEPEQLLKPKESMEEVNHSSKHRNASLESTPLKASSHPKASEVKDEQKRRTSPQSSLKASLDDKPLSDKVNRTSERAPQNLGVSKESPKVSSQQVSPQQPGRKISSKLTNGKVSPKTSGRKPMNSSASTISHVIEPSMKNTSGLTGVVPSTPSKSKPGSSNPTTPMVARRRLSLDIVSDLTPLAKLEVPKISALEPSTLTGIDLVREAILKQILVCRNCEEMAVDMYAFCKDCFREDQVEKNSKVPAPILCRACCKGMHRGKKKKSHSQVRFECNKLGALASVAIAKFPPGIPLLSRLLCGNCDSLDVTHWCAECGYFQCIECNLELHKPKKTRNHFRALTFQRFMDAAFEEETSILNEYSIAPPSSIDLLEDDLALLSARRAANETNSLETIGMFSELASLIGSGNNDMKSIYERKSKISSDTALSSYTEVKIGVRARRRRRSHHGATIDSKTMMASGTYTIPSAIPSDNQRQSDTNTTRGSSGKSTRRPSITITQQKRDKLEQKTSNKSHAQAELNSGDLGDVIDIHNLELKGDLEKTTLDLFNVINPFDLQHTRLQLVSLSVGEHHAAGVTARGTLFAWGSNMEGQLGFDSGDAKSSSTPVSISFPSIIPIKMVSCGAVHTICLSQSGQVYTWGSGIMGILGHASDVDRATPTLLTLPDDISSGGNTTEKEENSGGNQQRVIFVAAGANNSGVIVEGRDDEQQLFIWGAGQFGQIGTGDTKPSITPCLVGVEATFGASSFYPRLSSLAFGDQHTACVTKDGKIFTWGNNEYGQCGYGHTNPRIDTQLIPKQIDFFQVEIHEIACGARHMSCLTNSGEVYSWGSGETHQIGIFDNVDQFEPKKAEGIPGLVASIDIGAAVTSAVLETGETYVWGYAVGTPIPKKVEGLQGLFLQRLGIGSNDNIVALTGIARDVYNWDIDEFDSEYNTTHPRVNKLMRGKRVSCISSGASHEAVVTAAGELLVWGSNDDNQLGLSLETSISFLPLPTKIATPVAIAKVCCSVRHNLALSSTGQVLSWGNGMLGVLGHGSELDTGTPTFIASLKEIKIDSIFVGPDNSSCISSDGKSAYAWGANGNGQLGLGNTTPAFSPTKVPLLGGQNAVSMAFGSRNSIFLNSNGEVFTCGDNSFGQLGIGDDFDQLQSSVPKRVSYFSDYKLGPVSAIAASDVVVFAINQGSIYGWGSGETKQLGTGVQDDQTLPSLVFAPKQKSEEGYGSPVISMRACENNCVALCENNAVFTWGWTFGAQPRLEEVLWKNKAPITVVSLGVSSIQLM